jgi:hypothetical protein
MIKLNITIADGNIRAQPPDAQRICNRLGGVMF